MGIAFTKYRAAIATVPKEMEDGGKFLSWVDNEEFARIQAARQPGGLVRMDADKVTDKKAPKG